MRDDISVSFLEQDFPLSFAAALVAGTTILSGPLGLVLAPLWPQLPFLLGFGLLGACVLFVARLASLGHDLHRTRTMIALVATAVYATLAALNYTAQVALVPALARAHDPALVYLTMANPASPMWLLEMFAYAALGIALWVLAPMFGRVSRRRRWIRRMLAVNGAGSVAAAAACIPGTSWLLAPAGLVVFLGWNVLFAALMILVALDYRPRPTGTPAATA